MPKVHKHILITVSGILWTGVGLFLIRLAFRWFSVLSSNEVIFAIIAGLLLGSAIAYFGFSGLAIKNIKRINNYQEKVCVWAFQKWTTYLLIIFMMSLGIFMRNTSFMESLHPQKYAPVNRLFHGIFIPLRIRTVEKVFIPCQAAFSLLIPVSV